MNARVSLGVIGLVAIACIAACGASDPSSDHPIVCNVPAIPTTIYPIPGAKGVPGDGFTLVLYGSANLSIVQGQTTVLNELPLAKVPKPLPSPHAVVLPGSQLVGYAVGKLRPGTPYSVVETFANSGPCASSVIDSFTTR